MSKAYAWNANGLDDDLRSAAREAARYSGLSLAEWLELAISERARELGLHPDDFDDYDRERAVIDRLEKFSHRRSRRTRRGDRPAAPLEDGHQDYDRGYRVSGHGSGFEVPFATGYPAEPTEYADPRSRGHGSNTDPAIRSVHHRLANLEAVMGENSRDSSGNRLGRTLSRIEARLARLAHHDDLEDDGRGQFADYGEIDSRDGRHRGETSRRRRDSRARQTREAAGRLHQSLGELDNSLHDRRGQSSSKEMRRALSRLEARLESLADGAEPGSTLESIEDLGRKVNKITEMLSGDASRKHHSPTGDTAAFIVEDAGQSQSGAVRPRELARIEAKLNRLLEQGGNTSADSGIPQRPARRSITDAIAEINQRQQALDGAPGAHAKHAAVPASQSGSGSPMRNDLRSIASRLDELRTFNQVDETRDSQSRPAPASVQVDPATTTAFDALSQQVAQLNNALAGLAPKDSIVSVEQAIASLNERLGHTGPNDAIKDALKPLAATIEQLRTALQERSTSSRENGIFLDELRNQLDDVKHVLTKLAPKTSVNALETAVQELARRVDHSRQEGVKENILQPIEALIGDLKTTLTSRDPGRQLTTIERELQAISQRMEQLGTGAAPIDDPRLQDIQKQTASIKELLSAAVSRPMPVEKIERQINALGKRIDLIASRGSSPVGAAAVSENVEEIRASLQQGYPAFEFTAIQDRIEDLSGKFDEILNRSAPSEQMHDLSNRIDAVHKSISERLGQSAGEVPESVRKLERLMLDIRDRLESGTSSAPAGTAIPGHTQDIGQRLRELSEKIESTASPVGIQHIAALEENIQALSQKIDTVASGAGSDASDFALKHIAALEDNVRSLSEKIDEASSGGYRPGETSASANSDSLSSLEERIHALTEKIESVAANGAIPSIDALEEQVREIAERIDHPNVSLQTLTTIEQTMNGLLDQFEEARLSAADAAESAARNAAREALDEMLTRGALANVRNDESQEQIAKEISGLRAIQESKDIRTQATLSAVHETLEKVVDRLALLEDNIDTRQAVAQAGGAPGGSAAAFAARNATKPDAFDETKTAGYRNEQEELLASGPAPLFERRPPLASGPDSADEDQLREALLGASADSGIATTEAPNPEARSERSETEASKDENPQPANMSKALNLNDAEAMLWGDDNDDELLEPGTKAPRVDAGAPMRPSSPDAREGQPLDSFDPDDDLEFESRAGSRERTVPGARATSSFIAAARRASIAAQEEAEAAAANEIERKKGRDGKESALSDAPARAAAAAAALSGKLERKKKDKKSGESASPDTAPRSMLRNRKVLLSVGLAAVVLVLGTLQFLRMQGEPTTKTSAVDAPKAAPAKLTANAAPLNVASIPAPKSKPAAPVRSRLQSQNPARTTGADITAKPARLPTMASGSLSKTQPMTTMANGFIKPPASRTANAQVDRLAVASISAKPGLSGAETGNDLYAEAASGKPNALYELAIRHLAGRSVPRDSQKAFGLLQKAAAQGLAPARYRLASMYEKGIGTKRDAQKALHWYELAARAGNVRAMHNYAVLLAEGGGGKPNYAKAAHWFRKGADHGIRDSQYNLAILYARGLGIYRSMGQSYKWFDIAARQGDRGAASKRDQVGRRLSKSELEIAKTAARNFTPRDKIATANKVAAPKGGWVLDRASAGKPASGSGRTKSRKRTDKVSSL